MNSNKLRTKAINLSELGFLGATHVLNQAWNILSTVDGRVDTGACVILLRVCHTCLGGGFEKYMIKQWGNLSEEAKVNIAYGAGDSGLGSDEMWLELFRKSHGRSQHVVLASYSVSCINKNERSQSVLRKMVNESVSDLDSEEGVRWDRVRRKILDHLGS